MMARGKYVADLIDDGSTLQIGYGGIPDAVVMQLAHKHDLGVHTEMIGDGLLSLMECGAITNRRKNYLPGKSVATFALGSKRLYRFMDRNPGLEIHPVDFTNDPALAGRNDNLVAIRSRLIASATRIVPPSCGSQTKGAERNRLRVAPSARKTGTTAVATRLQARRAWAHIAKALHESPSDADRRLATEVAAKLVGPERRLSNASPGGPLKEPTIGVVSGRGMPREGGRSR